MLMFSIIASKRQDMSESFGENQDAVRKRK